MNNKNRTPKTYGGIMRGPILVYQSLCDAEHPSIGQILRLAGCAASTWNDNEYTIQAFEGRLFSRRPFEMIIVCVGSIGSRAYPNGMWVIRQLHQQRRDIPCIVIPDDVDTWLPSASVWELPHCTNLDLGCHTPAQTGTFQLFAISTHAVAHNLVPAMNQLLTHLTPFGTFGRCNLWRLFLVKRPHLWYNLSSEGIYRPLYVITATYVLTAPRDSGVQIIRK